MELLAYIRTVPIINYAKYSASGLGTHSVPDIEVLVSNSIITNVQCVYCHCEMSVEVLTVFVSTLYNIELILIAA